LTTSGKKRRNLEKLALKIINESGDGGILQSDLWKRIGVTSREGSRIAIRLEKKKLIRREKEYHSKRWTYRLYPVKKNHPFFPVVESPCIICANNSKCSVEGVVSPINCRKIIEWVLKSG